MANSTFIKISKHFKVSIDETDGHFVLTSNDNSKVLKVDKDAIIKKANNYAVKLGTSVKFIKGSKPLDNNSERMELEVHDYQDCAKKYCLLNMTMCCDNNFIVGTCTGSWSDC